MLPIIRLSQAWLDRFGWSLAEGAFFLEMDLAGAVPAGPGDVCPRPECGRHHEEYQGWAFVPDPATATPRHEHGRAYVLCVCGATYWYAAVDELNQPTGEARVRAASATVAPVPFAASDGLAVNVFDEIDATETVVVTPGTGALRFGA